MLEQTHQNFEIFVVGDGVSEEDRDFIRTWIQKDRRITFFDFPKGEQRGEAYRHEVLQKATGDFVCYLSDDDLWRPFHLAYIADALTDHDFAHSLAAPIYPDGTIAVLAADLSNHATRNGPIPIRAIPLTNGAHTMEAYRKLPQGWSPAPPGERTDAHMWNKFLVQPWCRACTIQRYSTLNFPSVFRKEMSISGRHTELRDWDLRSREPGFDAWFQNEIVSTLMQKRVTELAELLHRRTDVENLQRQVTELQTMLSDAVTERDAYRGKIEQLWNELQAAINRKVEI